MLASPRSQWTATLKAARLPTTFTPRCTRTTYITMRRQTLEHGQSVSRFTDRREVGHRTKAMIERVYRRVGEVRQRSGVVE